jgi:hypothetical protein
MPYNKRLFYTKVIEIQDLYLRYKEEGVTNEYIYDRYVRTVYFISKKTFYTYLGINAKNEIKKLTNVTTTLPKDKRTLARYSVN